jgi:hypothetical protein
MTSTEFHAQKQGGHCVYAEILEFTWKMMICGDRHDRFDVNVNLIECDSLLSILSDRGFELDSSHRRLFLVIHAEFGQ